jgi:hypothetical protein
MGNPIRLQPLFLILHCLLRQSSLLSVIGHYYTDLTLGASREFTLSRVSEEFNLHSTPQCTLFINPACRQFPMHSDWLKGRLRKGMLNIAGWPVATALLRSYNKLAIYWPASVSDWCNSCSLHRERKHDIPRPRFASGLGGHYRPLLHEVFTTSMFECVAYYRQMSSWFVWQAARTILSDLSHSSFALFFAHSCPVGSGVA